jgi:protein arginine kinase activator
VGKRYVTPEEAPEHATVGLIDLRDRLRRAVENEQFELAAELRDRIRVLE